MDIAAIFLKFLNMSFTGAVVAVMIMWVRLLYRMLPKKYLCIMWCVVLIRLLCPFTFPELGIGEPIQEPIPSNIMEMEQPYIASEIEVIDNTVNRVLEDNFTPSEEPQFKESMSPLQLAMTIGAYVWLAGIVGMLLFTTWKLHCFYKWVREAVPEQTLGKGIYRCAMETPVVAGIIRPRVYLPFSLQEPQLSHVLIHEKMHIHRKDHLLKLLFYLAVIVHWFNPLVWISYRLLARDIEMACDEAVLEKLGNEEKKNYCESLINLADSQNHFVGNPVAFGENDVKARIRNVLNYKKPRLWLSLIAVVLLLLTAIRCLNGPNQGREYATTMVTEMTPVNYPLTKEAVDEALAQVDLPGTVSEERQESEIRTSLSLRDEENRLIAGIASNGDGEKRFLGISWIGYLQAGAASVYLPEESWEDMIGFASLLYGFPDKSLVYNDFIENYEGGSTYTEYQYDEEPYYAKRYEWLKSYGEVSCQIEVQVATDGTKDISSIAFYNTPEYSPVNSEMAARNFLYFVFNSIPGRYEAYEEATDGKYNPINRDEAFLESDYSFAYTNHYKDRATENCLQSMEHLGYFTLVDYLAAQAGSQVRLVNVALTSAEDVSGDKDAKGYFYTVSLTNEKDGKIDEFTVQGSIGVANMLNGWKVTDFLLSDTEAMSMYITGDNVYHLRDELPVSSDHNILNEISFELPEGLDMSAYNTNVGYEGGCLFLPMVYEGDEEFTPDSWMSSGVVSRYTQSAMLEWKDGNIENVYPYYNHTYRENIEKVEGLCAPALLVDFGHDLYTAGQQAEMEENGVDLASIDTISKYWYLFIAEPGEEYGYVLTLNQKNFTKEDILELGETVRLLK